jgi:purine-binding chemotaxis protein CheW
MTTAPAPTAPRHRQAGEQLAGTRRLVATFWVDDQFFGVDALGVQEVLRHQPMTTVPLAPREVSGLINLRGQVVTALDLRWRLGLGDRDAGEAPPMSVVVRTGDDPVSFLVDRIGDVVGGDLDRLEEPPETMDESQRRMLRGVHKLEGRLLLVLDVAQVVRPMAGG